MTIDALSIGTEVVIDGDIPATISSICVESAEGSLSYKCVWWDERKRIVEWLPANEVKPKNSSRKTKISMV